jgi:hypothetical protein
MSPSPCRSGGFAEGGRGGQGIQPLRPGSHRAAEATATTARSLANCARLGRGERGIQPLRPGSHRAAEATATTARSLANRARLGRGGRGIQALRPASHRAAEATATTTGSLANCARLLVDLGPPRRCLRGEVREGGLCAVVAASSLANSLARSLANCARLGRGGRGIQPLRPGSHRAAEATATTTGSLANCARLRVDLGSSRRCLRGEVREGGLRAVVAASSLANSLARSLATCVNRARPHDSVLRLTGTRSDQVGPA